MVLIYFFFFYYYFRTGYFRKLGADLVVDTKIADDLALIEGRNEFIERFNTNRQTLPMLASSCPGFVCYAEKTHGSFILPYIATTRWVFFFALWFGDND